VNKLQIIRKFNDIDFGFDRDLLPDNQNIIVKDLFTDEEFMAKTIGCNLRIGQIINYNDIEVEKG